ncbi:hypothetical protein ABAL111652_07890 [Abyssicoccus albus]
MCEDIINDIQFPKQSSDYDDISNYLELNNVTSLPLSVFDCLWKDYEEWLLF